MKLKVIHLCALSDLSCPTRDLKDEKSSDGRLTPNSRKEAFAKSKLAMTLDYVFGRNTSNALIFSDLQFVYSRRTGRLKYVENRNSKQILFSFRPNGTIAPTIAGASLLLSKSKLSTIKTRPSWTVTVLDGVSQVVSEGRTVFCKHIVHCDDSLRAGHDVAILNEKGNLLAVGKSIISGQMMKQFKRGPAIKVREGSLKNAANEFG